LSPWTARRIAARKRLEQVRVSYLLFLMVVTQNHSPMFDDSIIAVDSFYPEL